MLQDMKDEFGSISSKSFGSRLRLQWVVDDSSMETIDDSKQSCWANMPPKLLTDVLMRIEASESNWPSRKNLFSCAGVCRSWRRNMKEIVKSRQADFSHLMKKEYSQRGALKTQDVATTTSLVLVLENILKMKDENYAKFVSAGTTITSEMLYEIENNAVKTVCSKTKTLRSGWEKVKQGDENFEKVFEFVTSNYPEARDMLCPPDKRATTNDEMVDLLDYE